MTVDTAIALFTRFDGDLAVRVVNTDLAATVGEVAQAAAALSLGRFVRQPKEHAALIVRRSDGDRTQALLDPELTLDAAGLRHYDRIEVGFAEGVDDD